MSTIQFVLDNNPDVVDMREKSKTLIAISEKALPFTEILDLGDGKGILVPTSFEAIKLQLDEARALQKTKDGKLKSSLTKTDYANLAICLESALYLHYLGEILQLEGFGATKWLIDGVYDTHKNYKVRVNELLGVSRQSCKEKIGNEILNDSAHQQQLRNIYEETVMSKRRNKQKQAQQIENVQQPIQETEMKSVASTILESAKPTVQPTQSEIEQAQKKGLPMPESQLHEFVKDPSNPAENNTTVQTTDGGIIEVDKAKAELTVTADDGSKQTVKVEKEEGEKWSTTALRWLKTALKTVYKCGEFIVLAPLGAAVMAVKGTVQLCEYSAELVTDAYTATANKFKSWFGKDKKKETSSPAEDAEYQEYLKQKKAKEYQGT